VVPAWTAKSWWRLDWTLDLILPAYIVASQERTARAPPPGGRPRVLLALPGYSSARADRGEWLYVITPPRRGWAPRSSCLKTVPAPGEHPGAPARPPNFDCAARSPWSATWGPPPPPLGHQWCGGVWLTRAISSTNVLAVDPECLSKAIFFCPFPSPHPPPYTSTLLRQAASSIPLIRPHGVGCTKNLTNRPGAEKKHTNLINPPCWGFLL